MKPEKLETIAFSEILKRTPDAFEAVAVIGVRSRQVNDRRAMERMLIEQDQVEEDYEDIYEPLEENEDYVELEKETLVSVKDFFADRLKWEFREKDESAPDLGSGDSAKS